MTSSVCKNTKESYERLRALTAEFTIKYNAVKDSGNLTEVRALRKSLESARNAFLEHVTITLERAIEVLGRENVHGPEDVETLLGFKPKNIPPLPYTVVDLEKSREMKAAGVEEMLVLFVKDEDGSPLTGEKLNALVQKTYTDMDLGTFLCDTDWYKDEKFYKELGLELKWKLVTKTCLPDSFSKQHSLKVGDTGYTHNQTQEYVIEQFAKKVGIPRAELKRPEPFLMVYAIALHLVATEQLEGKGKGERLLETKYHWSDVVSSDGHFVYVGGADRDGVSVRRFSRDYSSGRLGICLSR